MKILFIDDDLEVEMLAKIIQDRHPQDKIALEDSLAGAKQRLWAEEFDVVVIDIMMRADDEAVHGSSDDSGLIAGLLLLELVKKDKSCANNKTPFVILTGLIPDEHSRIDAAEKQSGKFFLSKPEHPDILYEVVLDAAKTK